LAIETPQQTQEVNGNPSSTEGWQAMAASGRKNADGSLLVALAAGQTAREAAETAGVAERTVFRRLANPAFRQRAAELRADMMQRALGRLADGMAEAAAALRKLLASGSDAVKLAAARAILEFGPRLRETVEFEERLRALEQGAAGQEKGEQT
jgi:hypothetical protein